MSLIEVTCVHLAVHMRQDATCDVALQEWEAPTGSSSGPGGCTNEMLKVCLDNTEALHLLTSAAEDFARSSVTKLHLPGVHDGYDDGPSDNLMGGIRGIANQHVFPQTCGQNIGQAIHGGRRTSLCAFSGRSVPPMRGQIVRDTPREQSPISILK